VTTSASSVSMPLSVRLHLGRAAVQTIADGRGIDILHIKGDAVDAVVRPAASPGSDIDILVSPARVENLDGLLRLHGWRVHSTFDLGSPFAHAQTYHHELWGYLDVHRFFPGIQLDPSDAFERLWASRGEIHFAGVACPVPSIAGQSAILMLNGARAGGHATDDVRRLWTEATPDQRRLLEAEIDALRAHLAWDAALGNIDRHRGEREYQLWRAVSQGGTRAEEWWGRLVAQPRLSSRLRVIARLPMVNIEHLGHRLGRKPSVIEVAREFIARPVRGVRELARRAREKGR
jgi:hypothetical protein